MSENLVNQAYFKRIRKVCLIQIISNSLLTVIKFIGGIIGGSSALISDGVNSFGDILTSSAQIIANKHAGKGADKEHQYGHDKIENLICLILSLIIIFSAVSLFYFSITNIIETVSSYNSKTLQYDDSIAKGMVFPLIIAGIVILTKFSLAIFTYFNYKKCKSEMLKSQAIDHITDTIGTFLSLISMLLIMLLYKDNNLLITLADPIASICVAIIILVGALKIAIDNSQLLLDKSYEFSKIEEIKKLVLSHTEIKSIDLLKSRVSGARVYIDMEITMDKNLSLYDSHEIVEHIRKDILDEYKEVLDVFIHANPSS
ncbi:MAG: cation diffusion facilitator family transporter [Mollicutes bacterium]|nr:cation diffusion facilitator family transporter [Mollicutes bacterium]MCI7633861.1 cation diffusion facilitator family transporter [Mollicutes bacterium]MDY4823304.1 cation diffusion facilitator family transporter [Candidatus Onthovivens sp.]